MKIICIGRNYSEHAKEMGSATPSEPVFFMKPDTALLREKYFFYPSFTKDLHYECELVVKISKPGKSIALQFAKNYYKEVSIGLDFTARDLQHACKEAGLPWEKAKSFDNSAAVSNTWISIDENKMPSKFEFYQNGTLKQKGDITEMIFSIDQIIAYISQFITLKTGDLIFTGTPAGVGPVAIGDQLEGFLEGQKMFNIEVK
jgi:2-keto-4-pentenoate hydratase/2-oxohepta-3-ene-1,7-dioic acid hydratase in catechol pathway